jgi:EAL and modified HD-GYP domain-containing signal transduction protein
MRTEAAAASPGKASPCIARQPILTVDEEMFGYELLFRANAAEQRFHSDADSATGTAIDTLSVVGLDVLCDGYVAFINCTMQMLLKEYFRLLPAREVVIEIQETIPADESVVCACQRLKQAGYAIALDNFVPGDLREPIVPYADFIKVDILNMPRAQSAALAARYARPQCRMLAQKVENRDSFILAGHDGYRLFQGYFFRHPERIRARQIPANQATYLLLLQAISKPETDFQEIEDLIKREPSLCFRLLRYLNSPLLGLTSPVSSVRHGLNLLGERELVRWIRMATTLAIGEKKPSDLVLSALVRARFCEMIAPKVKCGESDLFLLGMLSMMDAILEAPIGLIIEKLPLDADTRAQLLGGKTGVTTPLSDIYDLMLAREAGEWQKVTSIGKQLNLSLYFVDKTFTEAMSWAHQVTKEMRPDRTKPA